MGGWVVEVVTVVLVVGVFEEAKCPKKKEKRLTHFKTMPQAAGKNQLKRGMPPSYRYAGLENI